MKILSRLNRTWLAAGCAALTLPMAPVNADDGPPVSIRAIVANAGVTAALAPTSDPTVFTATAKGVVQTSLLGNCVEAATLQVRFPTTPGQPVLANGTVSLTSLDGANSLNLTVSGSGTPDPANPAFFNTRYAVTITGGTGAYVSARGLAEISEVVMFTSPVTATATWNMKGFVVTPQ